MNRNRILCAAAAVALLLMPALAHAQPVISSITPSKTAANTGAVVYIWGTGFGSLSDLVYFPDGTGAHIVNPIAIIAGGVMVRVPETWSGDVQIQANGTGALSNGVFHEISFNYSDTYWQSLPFTWYLNSSGAPGCTFNETRDALIRGYDTWECASGLSTTYGGSTGTATTANDGLNCRYWSSSGWSSGTIAVASWWYYDDEIVEADIAFNAQHFTWSCSGDEDDMDVQNIGTHEEGHTIGLLDLYGAADTEKSMYGWSGEGVVAARTLQTDDALGVEYMYPHSRANFDSVLLPGWYSPLVPRNNNNSTSTYAPLPSILNGNTPCYVNAAVTNNGGDCAAPSGLNHLWVDDSDGWWWWNSWSGVWSPGVDLTWTNMEITVRGGRHTLKYTMDDDEGTLESNEYDNTYTAQHVWSPYLLVDQVPVWRSTPPKRGYMTYVNCDGFEFSTDGTWWGCVGMLPYDPGDDFDLRIHNDTPNSTNGFDTYEASSAWGGDNSEFVIVNGNNGGGSNVTRWVGVNRWSGDNSGCYVQLSQNLGTISAPVESGSFTINGNDIVNIHEIYIDTETSWDFTLNNLSGSANLGFALYDQAGTHFGKSSYVAYSNGISADESFTFAATSTGFYGLVIFKTNSDDLGLTNTYELSIQLTPPNLRPATMTGWDYPVVLRNDDTAVGGSVHVSTVLDGTVNNTYFNLAGINDGPNPADHNYTRFYLDDLNIWNINWGPINPGQYYAAFNWGPFTARGGRHMVEWRNDWNEEIPETNESDNNYLRQYVWIPPALVDQTPLVRAAPPLNGWDQGFIYPNCDGFEFTWANYWGAVASLPTTASADYDVRLHNEAVTAENGFDTYEVWSGWGSGLSDFVLVNGNNSGGFYGTRQAGIMNWNDDNDDVVVQQSNTVGLINVPGTSGPQFLTGDMILHVFEIWIESAGHYTFDLDQTSGTADLGMTLYDAAGAEYAKSSYLAFSNSGGDGADETFALDIPTAGYYGIVIWKSTYQDHGKSTDYELIVSLTPPNLTPYAATGWDYPVVVRNDNTAVNGDAHVSSVLDGNQYTTNMSQCGINDGPNPAAYNSTRYYLDDEYIWWVNYGTINAGSIYYAANSGPINVRGGRHTLLWRNDWDNEIPELNELDNDYERQFVWSPLVVVDETPITRFAPPDRGAGAYPNCDGFQYQGMPYFAWVTASCPELSVDDFDLIVYSDYTGAESGFSVLFSSSGRLDGELDYVGGWYGTGALPHYPAVIEYNDGVGDFTIDAVDSSPDHVLSGVPALWPGETLYANRLVDVFEVSLDTDMTYRMSLTNLSGGADLAVDAHPPSVMALNPYSAEFSWDTMGSGGDENGDFVPSENGWYVFVVSKNTYADVPLDAEYDFRVFDPYTDVADDEQDLPTAFALRKNTPNPFNPLTKISFEVPAPGSQILLEIFDVTGHRVRLLVNESHGPGYHSIVWDGKNDSGEQQASGVYFYRLQAGSFVRTEKMTLVK